MDFLLAAFAPALSKVLEVSFLTGYATAYRLESGRRGRGRSPYLPSRSRSLARSTSNAAAASREGVSLARAGSRGKSLTNDPQRQGNIWHRYEQLENATNTLFSVNQQLVEERSRHKQERKLLEDTIAELQRQNGELRAGAGAPREGVPLAQPLSHESLTVLRDIESGASGQNELLMELNEAKQEVQRLTEEISDAHNQLEFIREEKEALAAENSKLQRSNQPGGRRRSGPQPPGPSPFKDEPGIGAFAGEVASLAAAKRGESAAEVASEGTGKLASFGSDIETQLRREEAANANAAPAQVAALQAEIALLKDRLAKTEVASRVAVATAAAGGADAVGGGAFVRGGPGSTQLAEQNRKLQEENQRLQNKVLRLDTDPARAQELEQKYNKLLEENTRLQSKVVRLNLGAPGVASPDNELLEELREENAELREDNDKLVAYLESLEKKKRELEEFAAQSGQGGAAAADLAHFTQLKSENEALSQEVARLRKRLEDAKLSSQGSFTTVAIPVRVEDGEEMDRDLWMLVEELRDQNRSLIEQLQSVRVPDQSEPKPRSSSDNPAAAVDSDNLRLANILSDENATLQLEKLRLTKKLAAEGPRSDGDVLQETIASSERLLSEKEKVQQECLRLLEKNARLAHENEALLKQLRVAEPYKPAAESLRTLKASSSGLSSQPSKGLFGKFSKGFMRSKTKDLRELKMDGDDASSLASAEHSESSRAGKDTKDSPGASRQLVAELIEENTKLFEENKRLGASTAGIQELAEAKRNLLEENQRLQAGMGLVKELTAENSALVEENARLSESVNKCLEENRELSNRLIDLALQNEEEMFNVAFGDGSSAVKPERVSPPPVDTEGVSRRQLELAEQMRASEEKQRRAAARRDELGARAANQLEAYEKVWGSPEKPAASPAISVPHSALELDGSEAGVRRRLEAELAKSELDRTIQAAKLRQEALQSSSPALQADTEVQLSSAEEKVRRAFYTHAGSDDLGGVMSSLGFPGFEQPTSLQDEGQLIEVFQRAVDAAAATQLDPTATAEAKLVAAATGRYLQDWYAQYTTG